jgi:hypothetical protein
MKLLTPFFFLWLTSYAETQVYKGEASIEGKLVYREEHSANFEDNKIKSAQTSYTDPSGKTLAKLRSNFSRSVNVPEHEMEDKKTGVYGVRYRDEEIIMYRKFEGQEETKTIKNDNKKKLLVAGQGLHYWILHNFDELLAKKKIELLFLIPGKLDTYNFTLKLLKSTPDRAELEVEIDSWFLRLFAPKLELTYDIKNKRLARYKGLSNLQSDKGDIMNVEIIYRH